MYKAVVFLLTATIVMGGPFGGDLDAIILDIYGPNSTSTNLIINTTRTERDTSTKAVGDRKSSTPIAEGRDTSTKAVGGSNSSTPVDKESPKCTLVDGTEGRCVVYYNCDKQDNLQNKDGLIDIHISSDNDCENYLDVCCPLK